MMTEPAKIKMRMSAVKPLKVQEDEQIMKDDSSGGMKGPAKPAENGNENSRQIYNNSKKYQSLKENCKMMCYELPTGTFHKVPFRYKHQV